MPEVYLEENQASKEEQTTIKLVNDLFVKAKRARAEKTSHFQELWDFVVKRKQWPKKRPSYRHSETLNFTFSIIQSIIPILTDNRPKADVLPTEASDRPFAEMLSLVLTDTWDRLGFDDKLSDVIFDGMVFGTSVSMIGFNPEAAFGQGEITWKVVDPLMFYPDPFASDLQDGKFCIYVEKKDLGELKRKYPGHADKLSVGQIERSRTKNIDVEPVDKIDSNREGDTENFQALLIRCWMKSEETVEIGLEGNEKETKKKYPMGRYIEVCNNAVLVDVGDKDDYPFADGLFPFAKYVDHAIPREFWGEGEVGNLMPPQRMLNKTASWIMDSLDSTGRPIWVVDVQSGVDTDNLTNTPGLVIEKNKDTDVHREPGTPVPAGFFNIFNLMKISFDQINGLGELSQGQSPAGVTSGAAIEQLQEASQTRLRQKARNLEGFLRRVGHLVISRIMQFYNTRRMFRVQNADEGIPEFFEYYIDGKTVRIQKIAENEEGEPVSSGFVNMGVSDAAKLKGFMDLKITVGSSLPYAKQVKARQSLELYDRQIIDREEVLKTVDWPSWEIVHDRMNKMLEAQAAAQAEQEAQGAV